MKLHPARHSYAFTLIELITVIAIISILMALLFPHLSSARDNARRQEASTIVKSIVNSCNNYKQDYGKFPPVTAALSGTAENGFYAYGDAAEGKGKVDNDELFDILRAISRGPNANHVMNTRQVKYYEGKKATDPRNPRDGFCDGSDFQEDKRGQLMDPWGKQYTIILESDGDEIIDMSSIFTDLSGPENFIRYSALAFSLGKNEKIGGKGYENRYKKDKSNEPPDDIVSW